jgi:hypothetical protein
LTKRGDIRSCFDFLRSWAVLNVNATIHEDRDTAELSTTAFGKPRGMTEAALIEAAGGDLNLHDG